jgi:RHS repeat-associated protein
VGLGWLPYPEIIRKTTTKVPINIHVNSNGASKEEHPNASFREMAIHLGTNAVRVMRTLKRNNIDYQGTFNNTHSTIETANNYGYDELGNLVRDAQEEIASIEWTVYGRMKKIIRNSGSSKADLEFGYDASGNRLWKKVTPKGSGAVTSTYYYLRDAQGNEMCRYVKYTNTNSQLMYVAQEHSIYGSSRVGVDGRKDTLYKAGSYSPAWGGANTSRRALGLKSFELANHLGNVLVTVSDKPVYKVSSGTIYFQPEVSSISYYYPFGAPIKGRSFSSAEYRFGFNTQEKDDEISGSGNLYTAEYWEYNSRLERRWEKDPVVKHHESPYACYANNPIGFIDPNGADTGDVVVAFGGGDIEGKKDAGDVAPYIIKQMQVKHLNKEGGKGQAFYSQYWGTDPEDKKSLDNSTQAAYDFILGNYNKDAKGNDIKGGRILIYGYSYGGVMAMHLSDRLKSAGLSVDVLFTVDAAAGPETDEVDRTIGSNVEFNVNHYQTESSGPLGLIGSHGAANSRDDGTKKGIFNNQYSSVEHDNIDDFTKQDVIRSMLFRLNMKPNRK